MIDWSRIRNPVMEHDYWSLKDPCVALQKGVFHLFCSAFAPGNRCQLLHVTTEDFVTFSAPRMLWGQGDQGLCSPDISCIDGLWHLTFQSWDPRPGHDRTHVKLWLSRSADLVNWERPFVELARNVNVDQRAIDPTVARSNGRWYCIYKQWQEPLLATADSLDDPDGWELLGRLPFQESTENGQLLNIDGVWHLAIQPKSGQALGVMRGDGSDPEHWMDWDLRKVTMPHQPGFNDYQNNAALYVADWRELDGHFYGVFHSRIVPEPKQNMSHWLGIARSRDLETWEFPGDH
ncbi:MAG: hypothetical protein ACLFVU_08805 [Phycisphaerae bacterium]